MNVVIELKNISLYYFLINTEAFNILIREIENA